MPGEPVTVDAAEYEKLMDEWALAIGRFMVVFTACEFWTYHFIYTFGSARMREAVGDMMLNGRAPLAEAVTLDIGLVPDTEKRVKDAFSKLKGLAVTRNLVAHNGPLLHPMRHRETGELFLSVELRSARDYDKSITVKQLADLTKQARELDEEFAILYGAVRQPENRVKA